jgi:PadR family transcriptional regulator, regulatory protein PadR
MHDVRITLAVLHVLRQFTDDVSKPRYGYDLMRATGYQSGKLYPILARLAAAGWLDRSREAIDPAEEGRPVRQTYTLSREGAVRARPVLAEQTAQLGGRRLQLVPRTQGGRA